MEGFREKEHRPFPRYENVEFILIDNHPVFLDLCYRRKEDNAVVYLATKRKFNNFQK